MDLISLATRIYDAAIHIDAGRKGFATKGKEAEGRISYEYGIERAMLAFQETQVSNDPQAIIFAEYTFISLEYQLCDKKDKDTLNSLTQAIESFKDALLALKAIDESDCKSVDQFFPHNRKYRVKGCPKDSFHIACIAHYTRLKNIIRAPGIDPIEKALLKHAQKNAPRQAV